jgi:dGTPase
MKMVAGSASAPTSTTCSFSLASRSWMSFSSTALAIPATCGRRRLDDDVRRKIEILKNYTFERHIEAARLKTVEYRGKEIVKSIFKCLSEDKKNQLLPADWKRRCEGVANERDRLRIICDFVAGMTDAYASEFYERLTSSASSTIFKDVN